MKNLFNQIKSDNFFGFKSSLKKSIDAMKIIN
jgi:hypothetical protein